MIEFKCSMFRHIYFLSMVHIIGASVSEPHTSESNWNFLYIFFSCTFRIFSTLYFNVIATGHMRTVSKIFVQFAFFDSQLA